jgi:hypothetical protein
VKPTVISATKASQTAAVTTRGTTSTTIIKKYGRVRRLAMSSVAPRAKRRRSLCSPNRASHAAETNARGVSLSPRPKTGPNAGYRANEWPDGFANVVATTSEAQDKVQ